MTKRHRAREVALQMLFQSDLNPDVAQEAIRDQMLEVLKEQGLTRFAWSLYSGVLEQRTELDRMITESAANWALHRMAPTDRNILRLGAFELNHADTPSRVVLDEMIELAKTFGSENSPSFVNGILDRLIPADKRISKAVTPTQEIDPPVES